jgi:hypothetical protein
MVVDGLNRRVTVEASTPASAREKAKRQFANGPVGMLQVFERLDPVRDNLEATREFFGARPPIIL